MPRQRLQSITIDGYTSIRSARVDLRDINVLVGANGSGKSNFISAFALLGHLFRGELNLFVGKSGGGSLLRFAGNSESVQDIGFLLEFDSSSYQIALAPAAGNELIISDERIAAAAVGKSGRIDISLGQGHRESRLREPQTDTEWASVANNLIEILRGCRVFHFHDTSLLAPVKQTSYVSDNIELHSDAGNLAAILLKLRDADNRSYRRIVRTIKQVAPFFRDFVLVEENSRLLLRWQQENSEIVFPADALSDGTLRFICLTTLLSLPELPALVVLDEPELGLHPYAIVQLAEMLHVASQQSQIIVATQSVTLINQFSVDDLIVVERLNHGSVFTRPNADQFQAWLAEYSLGDLWEKNILGGRPEIMELNSV